MSRYFNQSKVAVVAVWIAAMMMIYNRFTNSLNYERMLQVIEQTLLQESSPEDLGAFTKSSHAAISGLFCSNRILCLRYTCRTEREQHSVFIHSRRFYAHFPFGPNVTTNERELNKSKRKIMVRLSDVFSACKCGLYWHDHNRNIYRYWKILMSYEAVLYVVR